MAGSTKTGVNLDLSAEQRKKIADDAEVARAEKLKKALERISRKTKRRLVRELSEKPLQCCMGYPDKDTCLKTGEPYTKRDICHLCGRGGRI